MRRLYLQYRPDPAGVRALRSLQAGLAAVYPAAQAPAPAELHITVIHFGILDTVFGELRAVNRQLDRKLFDRQVERFVRRSEPALPPAASVAVEGYDSFGFHKDVLVLRLRVPAALIAAHATALRELQQCLAACGITEVRSFMAGNHNFQHALTFRPHLTLLKGVGDIPSLPPELKKLQVTVMPARYD